METKQCIRCKQEKELKEFYAYSTDKNGQKYYKNKCKECENELKRERRKLRKENTNVKDITVKKNTTIPVKSNPVTTNNINLSDNEIKSIKELLENKKDILDLIRLRQERIKIAEIEDNNKIKILVSLEENIKHKLYSYAKENNYSYSDIVSLAVIKYLEGKI